MRVMKEPHFSRLGSPVSPNGAVYLINDIEGVILANADVLKEAMQLKGITITPTIEQQIIQYCREKNAEFDRITDSQGIPDKIRAIFEFTKKSKLVAYCKRIQLTEHELFLLTHNCSQLGFTCKSKFTEFVPQGRKVLDSDLSEMERGNPNKFITKVDRIIEERKRYHVHLLEKGEEWHCFYFTYRDMDSGNEGHWKHGSHIHYVSHLWPNLSKRKVWESFDQRNVDIQGSIHIRLEYEVIDPRIAKE
jgi:hypothetical protein